MDRSHAAARMAVTSAFVVHGAVAGTFAARLPWIQQHAGLSASQLGVALTAPAIGAVVAMPLAAGVVHRLGGRVAARWLLAAWCASLGLPVLAGGLPSLWILLLAFGAAAGLADVVLNNEGVVLEKALGRPVMAGLHGMWGVGMLLGSAAGAVVAHGGVDGVAHLSVSAAVLLGLGLIATGRLLGATAEADAPKPRRFALPTRDSLAVGVVCFCAVFAEGAAGNWSAVYMTEVADASPGIAAFTVTAFMLAMSISRLVGNAVIRTLGPVLTVRLGGGIGALGAATVALTRDPGIGILGFVLLGVGIAVVVPLSFAAAGKSGTNSSQAIAGVATIAEGSNLVGPAIVGGIAAVASISMSFGFVALLVLLLIPAAGSLRVQHRTTADTSDRTLEIPVGSD